MKDILCMFVLLLPASVCFAGAVYIMSLGLTGWGWLVFAGICVSGIRYKSGD